MQMLLVPATILHGGAAAVLIVIELLALSSIMYNHTL